MPIVAVELATPAPPAAMARALLDVCSASVREGTCVLSTEATAEPRLAVATVTWSDATERNVSIEVHLTSGDTSARTRTIAFKDSDVRLERWRSAGLTIATLVGDALAPKTAGGGAESPTPVGVASFGGEETPHGPDAAKPAEQGAPPPTLEPPPTVEAARAPSDHAPSGPSGGTSLPHTVWAGLSGTAGPGLDEGAWKFGALVDVAYRPTPLPVFGRISFEYATRGTDSQGLSVQWQTVTLGAGGVLGHGALRLEPHLAFGVENVHAGATDPATGTHESGNQLGVSFHGGIDGILQLSRLGIVAFLQGKQALAPTRIVVKGEPAGTSPATGWGFGIGVRYFFE
jgi:hypothetical protein